MCRFISFFHNPANGDVTVWDLQSHSDTEEHLKLDSHWGEGHYTPDGTIEARLAPAMCYDQAEVNERIRERWPTFMEFWAWCMTRAIVPLIALDLDNTKVTDLSPLKGMKLKRLFLANAPVTDLTPLKGMQLTMLYLSNTKVTDLTPLKGMKLTTLYLTSTPVTDLTPLKGMELTRLYFWGTQVSDLTPLKGMKLMTLDLGNTKVADLTPLKGMKLTTLNIRGTPAAKKPLPSWLDESIIVR